MEPGVEPEKAFGIRKVEWCARLHVSTVTQALGEGSLQALHVEATEDGEILCFPPSVLQAIGRLCDRYHQQSFTILQGVDGTVYLLLDDNGAGRRLWALEELHHNKSPDAS